MNHRIALVTGANRGIGFETCRQLARRDVQVILTSRDAAKGRAAVERLAAEGLSLTYHQLDVSDPESIDRTRDFVEATFGRLDILVNNAGIFGGGPIDQISTEMWDNVLGTSLRGAFLCTRSAFGIMKEHGGGRIINIGSISAQRVRKFNAPYSSGKFGLIGLTQTTALEGREFGITCGILHPGEVTHDRRPTPPPGVVPRSGPRPGPLTQMTPEEIAAAAIYMASAPPHVNVLEITQFHLEQPFLGRG